MSKIEDQVSQFPRREFITGAIATVALASEGAHAQSASVEDIPIIDAHIHLFDNTRTLGPVTWLGGLSCAQAAFTAVHVREAGATNRHRGCNRGGVEPVYRRQPFLFGDVRGQPDHGGRVGYAQSGSSGLRALCGAFQPRSVVPTIRASRFYSVGDGKVTLKATNVANLKLLAQADLALDTANPSIDLMRANVLLADALPELRIIMDHLPSFDPDNKAAYEAIVKAMADRPNIFVKLTEVYHPRVADGVVVKDYAALRSRLEYLFDAFGENRVMFGSDYPNSYGVATISEEVGLMKRFFATKSRVAAEKFFWRNSLHVYKWIKRERDQPGPK